MTSTDLAVPTWGGDAMPAGVSFGPAEEGRHTPVRMTPVWARRLTDEIRTDLGSGIRKLIRAREGEAHLALEYPDWHSYCEAEFGDLRDLAIPASERVYLVASLKEARVSNRQTAARLGVGYGTVADDVRKLRSAGWQEPETVVSADGSVRSSRGPLRVVASRVEPTYEGMTRTLETLARVASQEDRGLTSVELDLETDWPLGTATGNLSRLERRGWIVRTETFRKQRAAYVATELGLEVLDALP